MSIAEINVLQALPIYPAALEFYQFVRATDVDATFNGTLVNRFGRGIASFSLEIDDEPAGFGELPAGAVGAIGQLSQPIYVNTGLELVDDEGVPLTSTASWIEYPNDRLVLGAVV